MLHGNEQLTDIQLTKLISEGDRSAFAILVRRHSNKFYSLAFRYLTNREEAEDVVQLAFLKLWEQPDKYNPNKNAGFTTWFYRVVVNLCLDHLKKPKEVSGVEELENMQGDDLESTDEKIARAKLQADLEKAINNLADRERDALNLCFYEELSHEEAAKIMGCSIKALRSLLMRAKEKLKGQMGKYL